MSYNGKTNWQDSEIVHASDMNRVEQGIVDLDTGKQDKIENLNSKASVVDADNVLIGDSAAQNAGKKVTFSVIKSTFKTYFDALYTTAKIKLTGYSKAASVAEIAATDTVNVAFGKVAKNLDDRAKTDLSNVPNETFKTKATNSGVITEVIPGNKLRVEVTVTSYNGLNISGREISVSGASGSSSATTDSTGHATLEMDAAEYTVEITNVPTGYSKPAAVSIGPGGGVKYQVSQYMDEQHQLFYGVRFPLNSSDPSAVVYTEGATSFNPAIMSGGVFNDNGWMSRWPFNQIKPCLFENGAVVGYLNPNNLSQFENGTAADITSGNAGDVMIEFPKIYYKFYKDSSYYYIILSDFPDGGYSDWAFKYKDVAKDKFYIGAYKGYYTGGKLRSLSGKTPTVSQTLNTFRSYSQANGAGYELVSLNKLNMLQMLYMLMFRHRNGQTVLGRGFVDGNSAATTTGQTNSKGACFGETTGKQQMCFLNIEDFWGNIYEWIDGYYIDASGNRKVANGYFSDSDFSHYATISTNASSVSGYISKIEGNEKLGFVIAEGSGSETTYFCDYGNADVGSGGRVPAFGGSWYNGSSPGPFLLHCYLSLSYSDSNVGGRLAFCG